MTRKKLNNSIKSQSPPPQQSQQSPPPQQSQQSPPPPSPQIQKVETNQSNSFLSNIFQGFSFGIGSSIAHKTVDGIFNSNKNIEKNEKNEKNVNIEKILNNNCIDLYSNYTNCINNNPNLLNENNLNNNCINLYDNYTNCINNLYDNYINNLPKN